MLVSRFMKMHAAVLAALAVCACAFDVDSQYVKSVKGGHSNYQYKGGDTTRFYGFNNTQQGFGQRPNQIPAADFEVGVCYVEVPTSSLVRDPSHIPAGNGSRPELSRIRACCQGYKRNVYNYLICEPVCTNECVKALCTAPEVCTCFPDHVKNLAGFCIATCPIGCQNGQCSGGECLCKEGFKLDIDGKFCVPNCRGNCGGIGNCTAPNTCECKPGYQSTSDGSCSNSADVNRVPPTQTPSHQLPSHPKPNNPQDLYGSFYGNPNPGPRDSLYPYNQNRNGSLVPGQTVTERPNQPQYPFEQNPSNQPYQGPNQSQYPFGQNPSNPPNQGPNQSQYPFGQNPSNHPNQGPNQSQYPYGQNPQYPTYPITRNSSYPPNHPIYPGNQMTQNPTNPYGQQPQNQYPHNPSGSNQGTFYPQYPAVQTFNVSIPQYPLYSGSQLAPNGTLLNPNQGGINPYQPPSYQGSNQGGYPYPQYPQGTNQPQQGGSYPTNPTGHQGHNPNSSFHYNQGGNSYPSNPQRPNQPQQGGYYPYGQEPRDFNQYPYDQSRELSPLCDSPCINGVCVEQNQCRCNPGYIRDEDDITGRRCQPYCPGGCPNGYCASPHSCACDEGYHKDTSIKGRPSCVKRIRRSADETWPLNVAELLVFEIPDDNEK